MAVTPITGRSWCTATHLRDQLAYRTGREISPEFALQALHEFEARGLVESTAAGGYWRLTSAGADYAHALSGS